MKNNLHGITEKMKKFLISNKVIVSIIVVLVLLLGITFLRSFAYYKADTKPDPIVQSKVGDIPDIEIRIMQEKTANPGTYEQVENVPDSNSYHYNAEKSYCAYDSTLNYNEVEKNITIDADGTDLCFAYFDLGAASTVASEAIDTQIENALSNENPESNLASE